MKLFRNPEFYKTFALYRDVAVICFAETFFNFCVLKLSAKNLQACKSIVNNSGVFENEFAEED